MIKACLFDLDGTLANTLESIAHAGNDALASVGYKPLPVDNYKYYAGDGAKVLTQRILRDSGAPDTHFDQVYEVYTLRLKKYQPTPYEGMQETLEGLKARGIQSAVVSNKPHVRAVETIEQMFGSDTFSYVQGLNDEVPRKPDPTGALKAAQVMGVKPAECMYFGDTNTDMQTGNRAGMYTVGVLWGFRTRKELEENHARKIIERPLDILTLVDRENGRCF